MLNNIQFISCTLVSTKPYYLYIIAPAGLQQSYPLPATNKQHANPRRFLYQQNTKNVKRFMTLLNQTQRTFEKDGYIMHFNR